MSSESKLSGVRVDQISVTHEDSRRAMTEIISSPNITLRDIKLLEIHQPNSGSEFVVGGHWEQGLEVQYIVTGSMARLDVADVESGDEKSFQNLPTGTRIYLPPGIAHMMTFTEAATLFVLNEVPYTPAKLVVYLPWKERHADAQSKA